MKEEKKVSDRVTKEEKDSLQIIMNDLKFISSKQQILWDELEDVQAKVKSEEVKSYIYSLTRRSKPETALREAFFAGKSVLSKYLFREKTPEVNIRGGFVDYLMETERNKFLVVELKPLFEAQFEHRKGKERVLTKLKQADLTWKDHKEQVLKYIREKTDFVILTNLKDWVFFNKDCSPAHFEPFFKIGLFEFYREYSVFENLAKYLEHKDFEFAREGLDKRFFADLKIWVEEISRIKFKPDIDKKRKSEFIIGLINKFIFIQTLDDYGVIDFRWIRVAWEHAERRWGRKGKSHVLREFFREVTEWFYEYYDTELFRENILECIESNGENIDSFYGKLQRVLGLAYWQTVLGFKGIMQYDFRLIDEDIFGKAYETYLAEIRKEQGIYYTPRYITEYIANHTVGKTFDELLAKIGKEINTEKFEKASELINRFISVKVLDPACGSGSFLIKAIRVIWKRYREIGEIIELKLKEYQKQYDGKLFASDRILQDKVNSLRRFEDILRIGNDRKLVSTIMLRHIHGNDLDTNALDVAKVNIWLEGIKLAPKVFRYDILPQDTNHILPDLEMNLGNGNSLIGLPEKIVTNYLQENHKERIVRLFGLREKYLNNPTKPEFVEEIEHIKARLRKELDGRFEQYLKESNLSEEIFQKTKPFHWALEFWYVYFDGNGETREGEQRGFDVVIGNPPYVDYRSVDPIQAHEFFKKMYFSSDVPEKYNLYVVFVEKAVCLLKQNGRFGYINPVQWMGSLFAEKLREFISNSYFIREIDDLSAIGVFEEPTLTNLGLFFFDKIASNKDTKIGYRITKGDIIERKIDFKRVKKDDIVFGKDKVFLLDPDMKVRNILRKLALNKSTLSDIAELEWGTSKSGYGKRKIKIDEYEKLSPSRKAKFSPMVQTADISRHVLLWTGDFIDKTIFSEIKQKQFKQDKIVFSRRSSTIKCGYDDNQFFLGKVAFISRFKHKADPMFLLGLLNSTLLNFLFVKVYETIHPGGNLRLDIPYLNHLPILIEDDKKLARLVDRIVTLKRLQHKFREIWGEYSQKYRNSCYSLGEILLDDKQKIQRGNFDKVWTLEGNVYPDEDNELLEREFHKFRLIGESDKILAVYGVSSSSEELILEIKTRGKEFRDILYCEIEQLLNSRSKVTKLKDIFSKTTISLIQPNFWENSPNLIKGTVKKFKEWLDNQDLDTKLADIVKIDNEIEDVDAHIDALVFKLYELTKNEIKTVLDSLGILPSYQEKVFKWLKE